MIAIITAGGKGTRLKSITGTEIPKPMVSILSKPILERQIDSLKKSGISKIIMLLGYQSESIISYFGDGSLFGINIEYVVENEPLGSAGGLFYIKDKINEDFIFIFGDLLLDIDWLKLYKYHLDHKKTITLFAHPNSHPYDSDIILLDSNNNVIGINHKNSLRDNIWLRNITNAGIYIVSPSIFSLFKTCEKKDFEKDIVSYFIKENSVCAYISSEYVKDIGTPERYEQAEIDLEQKIVENKRLSKKQKAIFLDRDGTINKYVGFLKNIDDFTLIENVSNAIKMINSSSYLAIVITNQPVIARGEVSFEELNEIHGKMDTLLGKDGAYLDALYFCPHHPTKGFKGERVELKIDCDCRKPKPGLVFRAEKNYNIDLSKSYFIGDTYQDMMTALNAGLKGILLNTGSINKIEKYHCPIYKHCDTLFDAVAYIINKEEKCHD